MQAAFARILNMSLTGSIVIAVVLLARLFLKRAPKIYSYALWAVVLFRLLCPLSITAGLSVLKPIPVTTTPGISSVSSPPVPQAVMPTTIVAARIAAVTFFKIFFIRNPPFTHVFVFDDLIILPVVFYCNRIQPIFHLKLYCCIAFCPLFFVNFVSI